MTTKWFSVKDSLPALTLSAGYGFNWESEYVLVYSKKYGVQKCCLYASEGKQRYWWWKNRHEDEVTEVTHWMFLPEKPEEEK